MSGRSRARTDESAALLARAFFNGDRKRDKGPAFFICFCAGDAMDAQQARADYVSGTLTYAQIAEKYGCGKSYIAKLAQKEGWKKQRDAFRKSVADKAILSKKERGTRALEKLMDSVDELVKTIRRINLDPDQFYRWRSEEGDIESKVADTRRLQSMSATVIQATRAVRNLYDIPDKIDANKDRREEKRLKILEARDGQVTDENAGVILMPQVMEDEPEDAPVVET